MCENCERIAKLSLDARDIKIVVSNSGKELSARLSRRRGDLRCSLVGETGTEVYEPLFDEV